MSICASAHTVADAREITELQVEGSFVEIHDEIRSSPLRYQQGGLGRRWTASPKSEGFELRCGRLGFELAAACICVVDQVDCQQNGSLVASAQTNPESVEMV